MSFVNQSLAGFGGGVLASGKLSMWGAKVVPAEATAG